jgi:hypothetical protein
MNDRIFQAAPLSSHHLKTSRNRHQLIFALLMALVVFAAPLLPRAWEIGSSLFEKPAARASAAVARRTATRLCRAITGANVFVVAESRETFLVPRERRAMTCWQVLCDIGNVGGEQYQVSFVGDNESSLRIRTVKRLRWRQPPHNTGKLLGAKQAESLVMEYLHLMNLPRNSLRAENKPNRVESITGLVLWNFRYRLNVPTHGVMAPPMLNLLGQRQSV